MQSRQLWKVQSSSYLNALISAGLLIADAATALHNFQSHPSRQTTYR
jgi:hypothetical protein